MAQSANRDERVEALAQLLAEIPSEILRLVDRSLLEPLTAKAIKRAISLNEMLSVELSRLATERAEAAGFQIGPPQEQLRVES